MDADKILLSKVLPEFSEELKTLLEKDDRFELAESVDFLHIYEQCDCGENSCASFYTAPKPNSGYGAGHENLLLDADEGWLVLDIVNNEIVFVEILDRPEYKKQITKFYESRTNKI